MSFWRASRAKRRLMIAAGMAMMSLQPSFANTDNAQRPDFSGVWTVYREAGAPPAPLMTPPPERPFTAKGQALRDEYNQLVGIKPGGGLLQGDNPGAFCVPYGMPGMMEQAGFYPIEFIHRPEQLTLIYEVEGETRRIYIGGKGVPPEQRLPTRQGYSQGHWEGNVLVVETTDLTDGQDQLTTPHSTEAKIVEKFSMDKDAHGQKVISYEMTLTDPVYYTRPVTSQKKWMPLPDGKIMAYNCTEEPWLRLLEARREQLKAGKPITVKMKDVIEVYSDGN